jgi:hypothetical protein
MADKKIVLMDLRGSSLPDADFKIKEVTNSVSFVIGDFVNEPGVRELCNLPEWTVKIVAVK